jgi:hypothetical protein
VHPGPQAYFHPEKVNGSFGGVPQAACDLCRYPYSGFRRVSGEDAVVDTLLGIMRNDRNARFRDKAAASAADRARSVQEWQRWLAEYRDNL